MEQNVFKRIEQNIRHDKLARRATERQYCKSHEASKTIQHFRFGKKCKLKTVAKLKTAANLILKNANEIADWILNTKAVKQILPNKILKLIDEVKNITDSKKPVNISSAALQNKFDESGDSVKLYIKKSSAFKNKAAQYELNVLNDIDPLDQMHLLNSTKAYLINKKMNQLNSIKCTEALQLVSEKLGGDDGTTIVTEPFFTNTAVTITSKNDVGAVLQNMRDQIMGRISSIKIMIKSP